MTIPLLILAVGAILAGFVGVPYVLNGNNAIEQFLEPSFVAQAASEAHTGGEAVLSEHGVAGESKGAALTEPARAAESKGGESVKGLSTAGEMGLMLVSIVIGVIGILVAYRFYVQAPEIAENLARRWAGPHRVLSNKYYVDELYAATAIAGTMASARGLWVFDSKVVDGAVNGSGWLTMFSSWFSHLIDKYVVDGLVNFVGAALEEGSYVFRRLQTGRIQNYALVMLFGVFAFVSIYLMSR